MADTKADLTQQVTPLEKGKKGKTRNTELLDEQAKLKAEAKKKADD